MSADACYFVFRAGQLPFSVTVTDAHTAVVEPIAGIPLPQGMHSGDQIAMPAPRGGAVERQFAAFS